MTNKTIKLSQELQNWIIEKSEEEKIQPNELITNSINFYIEQNKLNRNELMDKFFKLPKTIRAIIARCFLYENEYQLESVSFCFSDLDIALISVIIYGGNKDETVPKFSYEALDYFINFLKEHDIFNPEV